MQELADSIKASGLSQYPTVRRHPTRSGKYELISGERRWLAFKSAGLEEIPVIIKGDVRDDLTADIQSLNENLHRADLSPVEEENKIYDLQVKHKLTERELSRLLGRGQKTINHVLLGKRFREKLPSRIRLSTSKTALWETEFIKNEKHRIRVLELIHDKRIKLERVAIRDAADLIARAPREVQEAYFAGLLTIEEIDRKPSLCSNAVLDPVGRKIPIELKKALLNSAARLIRYRQAVRKILTDEETSESEKKEAKKGLEGYENKIKAAEPKTKEHLRSEYGAEAYRALGWWIDFAAIEKTLYLRNEQNGEDLQSAVLDVVGARRWWDAFRKSEQAEEEERIRSGSLE